MLTRDELVVIAAVLFPLPVGLLIQFVGERKGGYTGRQLIRIAHLAAWLWYSIALSVWVIRVGVVGFLLAAVISGVPVLAAYVLSEWAWKDLLDNYDRYVERRRRRQR